MSINPNPQPIGFASWEAPVLTVTMTVNGSIAGQSFIWNIRDQYNTVIYQITNFTVVDPGSSTSPGIFSFPLTSFQAGTLAGDYKYDVWRINPSFEKRLVYGALSVSTEQWK